MAIEHSSGHRRLVLALLPALLAAAAVALSKGRQPAGAARAGVRFTSPGELRRLAEANGLCWQRGSHIPCHTSGNYVTDRAVPEKELARLCKAASGLTPAWRGIVWVIALDAPGGLPPDPDHFGGARRVWGRLLAMGDEQLLDRIEGMYRRHVPAGGA